MQTCLITSRLAGNAGRTHTNKLRADFARDVTCGNIHDLTRKRCERTNTLGMSGTAGKFGQGYNGSNAILTESAIKSCSATATNVSGVEAEKSFVFITRTATGAMFRREIKTTTQPTLKRFAANVTSKNTAQSCLPRARQSNRLGGVTNSKLKVALIALGRTGSTLTAAGAGLARHATKTNIEKGTL